MLVAHDNSNKVLN